MQSEGRHAGGVMAGKECEAVEWPEVQAALSEVRKAAGSTAV